MSDEQEWLVDRCGCGHHITAHAKGIRECRKCPRIDTTCGTYRWDGIGIRRVPADAYERSVEAGVL